MSNWPFVKLERTRLKNHAVLAETWIHDRIAEDPEILGLGTLTISNRCSFGNGLEQFVATRAGSDSTLALLVQCGSTDEAQLVRALESWSQASSTNARGTTAVLVSEDVNKRYLDLIPSLSAAGQLAAIQMEALQIGQQMTVIFTPVGGNLEAPVSNLACEESVSAETSEAIGAAPVTEPCTQEASSIESQEVASTELGSSESSIESVSVESPGEQPTSSDQSANSDQSTTSDQPEIVELSNEAAAVLGDTENTPICEASSVEAPSGEVEIPVPTEFAAIPASSSVDRGYWERSAPAGVEMADRLLSITQAIDPSIELTYRTSYIGLARQGGSSDFAKFTPEPSGLLLGLSLEPNSLIELSIAQAGLERLQSENECDGYKIRLAAADIESQRAPVARLIQLAYEESRA